MASTIEKGHAKNIANFEDLISFCIGYGTMYNPGTVALQVPSLQTKYTSALADLQAVVSAKTLFDNATNERVILFKELSPLLTRIISALSYSGVSKQTLDDAKGIIRKLRGATKKPKEETPSIPPMEGIAPVESSISASRQSYDAILFNFMQLVDLVSAQPLYTPNESDLSVAGLQTRLANMQASVTNVTNAITAINNARINRDKGLYDSATGLVKIALDVKQYVRSLYGKSSPEFKKMVKLEFNFIGR